jgi:acetaldehyde dehydrogenase/alcohol dehydrogenase
VTIAEAVKINGAPLSLPRARNMLERARWAAATFSRYDHRQTMVIAEAVASAAANASEHYGDWAVRETGFGVAEHKALKNRLCSAGVMDDYRGLDLVTPRTDPDQKFIRVPRPAGVIFALTPSTNPVATLFFNTLLALMTRNSIVISPHPLARACCADAARLLADAAHRAGAPDGVIQVVDEPTIPLIEALMSDELTDVIVATGGSSVVRAAYRSGTPAIGVGPGNVPVMVDRTADIERAAERIVDSKSFDNSVLCTNESAVIVEEAIKPTLMTAMKRWGAYVLSGDERDRVRDFVFPAGCFNTATLGQSAEWIASQVGIRVSDRVRVLVAPFDTVIGEEPLAHEKLCPVLGLVSVPNTRRAIDASRTLVRIGGAGHSAAIHSHDAATIMDFTAAVEVLRVSVNVGNSTGASGIDTNLPLSMTLGTGFVGSSSVGRNLEPADLINWTIVAFNSDPAEPFADFDVLQHRWAGQSAQAMGGATSAQPNTMGLGNREEIRAVILEEFKQLMGK